MSEVRRLLPMTLGPIGTVAFRCVASLDRKLRTLLEIDDDRHCYPSPIRPMRMRRRSGIAEKVARLWWLLHSFFLAL